MSFISRALMRFQPSVLGNISKNVAPTRALARSLAVLCSNGVNNNRRQRDLPASTLCSCGCGIHGIHTRGDIFLIFYLIYSTACATD